MRLFRTLRCNLEFAIAMKEKFFGNLLFLLFVNLLVKPFYIFGIDRTVQVTVGDKVYGLYFTLYNVSVLFYILLDLGMTNYNNRTIAQDTTLLRDYVPNFLLVKCLLSIAYLALLFILVKAWQYDQLELKLLLPLALNQVLISFIFYFRSNISALHYFKIDGLLSVLDRVLVIVICTVLLWGGVVATFRIEYFIYAQTFAYAVAALVSFAVVARYAAFRNFKVKWATMRHIIRKSLPFALLVLLMTVYNRVDSIMLERLLPEGAMHAGIYAKAFRLLDAVNVFGLLFAGLLMPIFARMLKERQTVEALSRLSLDLISVFSMTVGVCCYFFRTELMNFIYDDTTVYTSTVFGWLMFSFMFIACVYIYGTLMIADAKLRPLNIIAASGLVLNIVLNFILIPRYQAIGATVATLVTQFIVATGHIIVAKQAFKLTFPNIFIIRLLSFFIILFLLNIILKNTTNYWIINFGMILALSLAAAFLIRLLRLKELVSLLKK